MAGRLLIEYDGGGFAGWARQPGLRTVQAELEAALQRVLGRPVALTVAGRTDAGVHARGQVASHEGDTAWASQLNGVLARDVRVLASDRVEEGFDARRDATARVYRYRLFTRAVASPFEAGRSLHWPHSFDRAALDSAAAAVVGTHDFTAFTPTQTDHVLFRRRVERCEWVASPDPEVLELWIEAETFMRHMVRALVGTMLEVAGGRRPLPDFERLLSGRPRAESGDTAAPHGLYLESVRYR